MSDTYREQGQEQVAAAAVGVGWLTLLSVVLSVLVLV